MNPALNLAVNLASIPAVGEPVRRKLADRLLRPTLPELWTFLAVALPALAALIATLPTVDLAYQLRAGSEILAGRGIPSVDTWTFTASGEPWLDQQWGAQAILAAIYQAAGWAGLAILRAGLVAVTFGLVLVAVRRRAPGLGSRPAAWLTLAAFVVAAPALALRPQLLGMACFALALVLVAGRRERPGLALLLPVVAIAWANVHGSFILAPVLAGLAFLEDVHERSPRAGRMLLVGIATGAATLVTPFGLGAWRYAAGLATNREVTARITEWQPTTPTDIPGVLFWGSVVLVAIAVVRSAGVRGGVPWPALLTLVAFAGLGAVAARGVAWWPPLAAVTISGMLLAAAGDGPAAGSWPTAFNGPGRASRGSRLHALVGAGLVLAAIGFLPTWRATDPGTGAPSGLLAFAPSGATAALRDLAVPDDRVWNPQPWGSWFEFAVPDPAYALDSRIEVIPPGTWRDAEVLASAGPGWDGILDAAQVTIVITDPQLGAWPLTEALATSGRWALVFSDGEGAIWVRAGR